MLGAEHQAQLPGVPPGQRTRPSFTSGILVNCIESSSFSKIVFDINVLTYQAHPGPLSSLAGVNTKLNCLEYHRDSEVNIGSSDFILLLAKQEELVGL